MKCRKISKSLSMHSFEPKMDEVSPTTIFFRKKSKAFFRATSTHINTTFVTTPSTENDKLSKPSIRDTTVWPSVTNVMSVTVIRWRWLWKNEDSLEIGYLLLNYKEEKWVNRSFEGQNTGVQILFKSYWYYIFNIFM